MLPFWFNIWGIFMSCGFGILALVRMFLHCQRCVVSINAVCVDYDKSPISDIKPIYTPVLEYEYKEKKYRKPHIYYSAKKPYEINQEVEIKINPTKPEEFSIGKETGMFISSWAMLAMGVIWLINFIMKLKGG